MGPLALGQGDSPALPSFLPANCNVEGQGERHSPGWSPYPLATPQEGGHSRGAGRVVPPEKLAQAPESCPRQPQQGSDSPLQLQVEVSGDCQGPGAAHLLFQAPPKPDHT